MTWADLFWRVRLRGRRAGSTLMDLRRNWNLLAQEEPYWAILSDPAKRGGGWDVDAFLETGAREIAEALSYAETLPLRLGHRRALDFGCGVGRLSRALAGSFRRVEAVDVSEEMLRQARILHRDRPACRFRRLSSRSLPFPEAHFDLVYSRLVLQHVPTDLALDYVREFVRVLRPGGLALFQAPSRSRAGVVDGAASPVQLSRGTAYIEMHAHPVRAVREAVGAAGGRVMDVQPDDCAGPGFESVRYAVTR